MQNSDGIVTQLLKHWLLKLSLTTRQKIENQGRCESWRQMLGNALDSAENHVFDSFSKLSPIIVNGFSNQFFVVAQSFSLDSAVNLFFFPLCFMHTFSTFKKFIGPSFYRFIHFSPNETFETIKIAISRAAKF